MRREANERVETVRDTVRETKVDVDKEPADRRVRVRVEALIVGNQDSDRRDIEQGAIARVLIA